MYDTTSEPIDADCSHVEPTLCGGAGLQPEDDSGQSGCEPACDNGEDTHGPASGKANFGDRLSRNGSRALPATSTRRSRLQEVSDSGNLTPRLTLDSERGSLTPAMRKRYLKGLLMNNPSHSGLSNVLSSSVSSRQSEHDTADCTGWALYPVEHAWMLSAVDGNYETIMDFISEDPYLLTKKDFVSGFTVLHWLAKRGQHETLIKLLKHAEKEGIPVNVNLKGSAGLTPLHVAAMHSQYMVIKILVGAFSADVEAMDHNGRRAWQYLKEIAPMEIKELLGAWDDDHSVGAQNVNNNCATQCPPSEEERDEVDSFDRPRRAGSWRFGSFKKLLSSFSYFGGKS